MLNVKNINIVMSIKLKIICKIHTVETLFFLNLKSFLHFEDLIFAGKFLSKH